MKQVGEVAAICFALSSALKSPSSLFAAAHPVNENYGRSAPTSIGRGLYMPAEHNPHNATLMAFPTWESIGTWDLVIPARTDIAAIANTISSREPIWMYARAREFDHAKAYLSNSSVPTGKYGVQLKEADVDQLWIRDYGPIFVKSHHEQDDNEQCEDNNWHSADDNVALDFNFNFWGDKYPWTAERSFTSSFIPRDFPSDTLLNTSIVTEGGNIDIDGEGTLLAAESAVINDNRNPGKTKEQIEAELKRTLGVQKIIWLQGLKGYDVTDDHIDAFARFVQPGVVIISQPPDNAPANVTARYQQALQVLQTATDAKGRTLEVHPVREADQLALGYPQGIIFKAITSYVNWFFANGALIMPRFGDSATDDAAMELYRGLFDDREVVQVDLQAISIIGGGIPCSTQQVPA